MEFYRVFSIIEVWVLASHNQLVVFQNIVLSQVIQCLRRKGFEFLFKNILKGP